ncbi:hypothetical protein AQUCO_01800224v1 [Aquilegia coerulea]|uniref:X8 domain-containing protein n=1 Tax=Aquilegia coerulea TaxID=218851 RepID=A0A2G5DKG8_AQUCA|nr:hypothetical protein AQUCO_01800224v1 [Aquilegia coerulea]
MGWFFGVILLISMVVSVNGIGANWGTQVTHPLPPKTVVKLLRDNGFLKVKLFDADYDTLRALGKSGIEVMVGIPNDMLATMATSVKEAEKWVSKNVSTHITNSGVNIRYVAVGNEPFLQTYNGTFLGTTFPALRNIQSALIKAGLGSQVKATVPLNADVYESSSGLPSGGDFRPDIHDLMLVIVKFLNDNATPVIDNGATYTNMFDANHDTLVWALQKNGFANMPIIIGEIGWPTDGDRNANLVYAQRFNQGFMSHISNGKGTPMRAGPVDAYLFSLIDEDAKSIDPGNFERHWGIFYYDGLPKYQLNLGTTNTSYLVPAKDVHYLDPKWCVMSPSARLDDPQVALSVSYACARADCTSLGYGTSCGNLDARGNISYAFNSYYQIQNQADTACKFPNLSMITKANPSTPNCRFVRMTEQYYPNSVLRAEHPHELVTLVVSLVLVLVSVW